MLNHFTITAKAQKSKKTITLFKKQMKDQVLLDLILSSLEGI